MSTTSTTSVTDSTSQDAVSDVELWFDPLCPWAWMTSRWLLAAAEVRPLRIRFRIMSLTMLNEGRDLPRDYLDMLVPGIRWVRVAAAVEGSAGAEAVSRYYTEVGTRFHNQHRDRSEETVAEALAAAGLPAELIAAADDASYDPIVRASHDEAMAAVGTDVGTPVIRVGDVAFFGPVITPAPKGEAAGKLWDGVLLVAGTDGFYELKRTRDRDPIFD